MKGKLFFKSMGGWPHSVNEWFFMLMALKLGSCSGFLGLQLVRSTKYCSCTVTLLDPEIIFCSSGQSRPDEEDSRWYHVPVESNTEF